MPVRKVLLTSFRPWLSHHRSNSSDDLLGQMMGRDFTTAKLIFLRQLPVDTQLASAQVIGAIAQHQPDIILCCGMAESYQYLTIESQAFYQEKQYQTHINLPRLTARLKQTRISNDAGKFVCEGLYFHVLQHIQQQQTNQQVIFVHVPLLTTNNLPEILQDFQQIVHYLSHELDSFLS